MSYKKISLLKLKKKCQENFYKSIDKTLNMKETQTYIPVFTSSYSFENEYSKRMFIFNSKYILLGIKKEKEKDNTIDELDLELDIEMDLDRKSKLKFDINQLCQGNILGKVVNKNLYIKSKDIQDYNNYVAEIPMFIKSNPLIDVLHYMEGKYEFNTNIPSIFSYLTNKKINDINNNAYLEVIVAYFLNLLNENEQCTLFPHYYGAFNGLAENYHHDISEDYPHIKGCPWFKDENEKLQYEIVRDNNLDDFQELSLKNIHKVDYDLEKDLKHKEEMDLELNNFSSEDELDNFNVNFDDMNLGKEKSYTSESNESDSSSNSSWSDISSVESCIFNETYVKLKNFPIQILAMERLQTTLTELVKKGISVEEWKTILFELCFGMAIAQKYYSFIHNDLHSDNIMFKKTEKEYKYYKYQNFYFKVPTFGRETKVIDFARGIIKVNKKTYFSDVFKKDGDAGGQYNYLENTKNKNFNFSFDLARFGTTIAEFIENSSEKEELFDLINCWTTNKNGDNFLDMDDDFSLYVIICETASNAIPKEQLKKKIFNCFRINKSELPSNCKIYDLN